MSVLCSSHNLSQLEALNQDLSLHCYALDLILNEAPSQLSDRWCELMVERVNFLEQTCGDLQTFTYALRQEIDFEYI